MAGQPSHAAKRWLAAHHRLTQENPHEASNAAYVRRVKAAIEIADIEESQPDPAAFSRYCNDLNTAAAALADQAVEQGHPYTISNGSVLSLVASILNKEKTQHA